MIEFHFKNDELPRKGRRCCSHIVFEFRRGLSLRRSRNGLHVFQFLL